MPSFLISYKFNPPDDDNPDDITHTIRTHIAPKGKLHVGDALPILYIQSTWNIQSMPFPFPLNDLLLPGDYIHAPTHKGDYNDSLQEKDIPLNAGFLVEISQNDNS